MSEVVRRVRARRAEVFAQAKEIADRAAAENRALTDGEERDWAQLNTDLDRLDARLTELRETDDRARNTEAAFAELGGGRRTATADRDLDDAFRNAVLRRDPAPIDVNWAGARSGWQPGVERRDLVTTGSGGMLGVTFYDQLVEHIVDNSAILAAGATMITTATGEPLSVPKTTALSTAAIVGEAATIDESDPGLGKVTLGAYKYGILIEVSTELVNDVNWDLTGYLARETGLAIANGAGAHFVAGTGTGQPRGLLNDVTAGATGAATVGGAFSADDLITLAHSLAEGYSRSPGAAWLMSQATLGEVRKLTTTGSGEYIFRADVIPGSGAAGTLLGRPVFCDPNVPAIAAGAKSVLFGDMTRFMVRQVNGVRFERSDDYGFNRDVATFRALWRADGALVDTSGSVKAFVGGTA